MSCYQKENLPSVIDANDGSDDVYAPRSAALDVAHMDDIHGAFGSISANDHAARST
jgi:hypothetical protein